MRKTLIIILIIIALGEGALIFYRNRAGGQKAPTADSSGLATVATQNPATKIDDQKAVTVVVTPTDISPESKEWKFDVGLNTHAGDLDQDMVQISVLVDDRGNEYKPSRWDGAPAGGHHREGVIVFERIAPAPKSVELKIAGIGDVDRIFSWQIK